MFILKNFTIKFTKKRNKLKKINPSNQTLEIVLGAAIALSLIGTFVAISNIGSQQTIKLVGYGLASDAETGIINLTVGDSINIEFIIAGIDLGSGSVAPGEINCSLFMDGNPAQGCVGFNDQTGHDLVIANIGNLNASINLSFDKNSAQLIGGTSPSFYLFWQPAADGACRNTTGASFGWTDSSGNTEDQNYAASGGNLLKADAKYVINTTNDYLICPNLNYAINSNNLTIGFNIVVPADSFTGNLSSTITATAYLIDSQQ